MFPCDLVNEKALAFGLHPKLKGRIFLAGGLVPWVLSGEDSNRLHSDIDFVVPLSEMETVRAFLKEQGLYDQSHDSLFLPCNQEKIDFGTEVFLNGLPISFTPFFQENNNLFQRDFTTADFSAKDSLVTLCLSVLSLDDYITSYSLSHGQKLYCTSLEFVYTKKIRKNRPKDLTDLRQMETMDLDQSRLARIAAAFSRFNQEIQT
ncbi:hypothetical protein [Anaerotignum sp.]|uniref:hypothetical protein n=2 Tax=Anaerotignum sp. TaxID=2039241 RepID=UPI002A910B3E|nr:hypothetical protein [Anaerotignum sp.]MCI7656705.1 hypothetical protein [Clostridia bacterium]MDY5414204.1 hypothetical protein [Anaerotignum sp.]